MRSRIITLLAACLLTIGTGSFLMANTASAITGTGTQYCFGHVCLNAWNGGPYVNTNPSGAQNNWFLATKNTNGYYGIQWLGNRNSPYITDCIGDYNNDPNDARAGLYSECFGGLVAWGANFTEDTSCGPGQIGFRNVHWGGWLAPAALTNGQPFYLNNPVEHCFAVSQFNF